MGDILRTYKITIILGIFGVLLVSISSFILIKSVQINAPIQFSSEERHGSENASEQTDNGLLIDIEGAVNRPGLYKLPLGSRVEDALVAAGGVTNEVDNFFLAKNMNRAEKLVDGMKIYIPIVNDASYNSIENKNVGGITSYNNGSSALDSMAKHVAVNTALADELDSLPGVGPVTAQKIIANRPYQTLEELVTKKAIGQALFEKLKNNLSLY